MASELIGWIEMDEAAPAAALLTTVQPLSFRPHSYNTRMTANPFCPAQITATEFIEADVQQLQAELELEFAQLLQRKRAK